MAGFEKFCLKLIKTQQLLETSSPILPYRDFTPGQERGGTPFRQIFWSRNGAPANIVGHRWNANTEAFWQITSYSLG